MPTDAPPPASKRIAESLHRKIQIVSRAVRLLEHKLRGEVLLSVSNILSIIHKEEGKIKGVGCCWKKVLDCVADTAVTYGLMWVFYLPQLSEIYIPGVVSTVHVIVLIWTKQMTGIIMHHYQICCQLVQITMLTYFYSTCVWVWLKLSYS